MVTIGEIRIRYPEFSDEGIYSDARIQLFIDDAVLIMCEETRWLGFYNIAQAALVAHLLTVAEATEGGDGNMYPIKRQEVDDTHISSAVADVQANETLLFSTTYGRIYYRYLRLVFTTVIGV